MYKKELADTEAKKQVTAHATTEEPKAINQE